MWYQLTTNGKECVGLLSLHCSHTFQSTEPSPADVHPTLHFRLPKLGAEQCDGDDILLLLGGIYLLGAPERRRLCIVHKELMGSLSYSSIISPLSLCKTHIPFLSLENTSVNDITLHNMQNHRHMSSYFSLLPAVSFTTSWKNSGEFLCLLNKAEMCNNSPGLSILRHCTIKSSYLNALWSKAHSGHMTFCFCIYIRVPVCN